MALEDTKIGVLGLWHLGSVYSAGLADLGYQVVGMDDDGDRVANLNRGLPPLFEPGLAELISWNLAEKRLAYTTQIASAVEGAAFVLFTYDTPVDDRDRVDLSGVFAAAREVARHLESGAVVVVSSQVPVGTCHQIQALIQEARPGLDFGVACCPENLRLGQALRVFRQPDFLVIGAESPATLDRVEQLFASIDAPKVRMDLKSAEMTKHAINTFLGMSICYINELANLCDEVGADAIRVASALKLDRRIGPGAPLFPGLGFAGGTLARDLRVLQRLGDERSYPTSLVDAVLQVNRRQNGMVVRRLEKFYGSLARLTLAVLGLTYKAGTSTLRRSSALEIIAQLVRRGARVKAHDPKADPVEVRRHREFQFCPDPYEAVEAADGLVVITNWPEFKELDFERMKSLMKRPFILDAQNMLNGDELLQKGFTYAGIGRGRRL